MEQGLAENVAENPLTGERFVFTKTTRETNGEFVTFDFFVAPGGGVPMVHHHAYQTEVFRGVKGKLAVTVAGVKRELGPGDELVLPPGTLHSLCNEGTEEVQCEVEYRPAQKNEAWLKVVNALVRKEKRDPKLLELAAFIGEVDIYIEGPPIWLQKVLFSVLRPLSIAFGHKRRMLAIARETYGAFEW
ncbi:MAG: cupin domain-containing protein [Myxococcales bacterium]|nr:cupin domain-containing protein [Myxococcales bacterium]